MASLTARQIYLLKMLVQRRDMEALGWRRLSYRQIVKQFEANEDARAEANLLRLLMVGTELMGQLRVKQSARGGTTVSVMVTGP